MRRLELGGYITRQTVRVAEGHARDATVWSVRWRSPQWRRVACEIGHCELPRRPTHRSDRVPRRLAHLFWNVAVDELHTRRDARYIADRILRNGDAQGLAWLTASVPRAAIAAAARGRGLEARRAALGRVLAGASGDARLDASGQRVVEGIRIASIGDLLATKLNAITSRPALRDYVDLQAIEERAHRYVEEGLALFVERYRPRVPEEAIAAVVRALASFEDIPEDPSLDVTVEDVARFWGRRIRQITRHLDRW